MRLSQLAASARDVSAPSACVPLPRLTITQQAHRSFVLQLSALPLRLRVSAGEYRPQVSPPHPLRFLKRSSSSARFSGLSDSILTGTSPAPRTGASPIKNLSISPASSPRTNRSDAAREAQLSRSY